MVKYKINYKNFNGGFLGYVSDTDSDLSYSDETNVDNDSFQDKLQPPILKCKKSIYSDNLAICQENNNKRITCIKNNKLNHNK